MLSVYVSTNHHVETCFRFNLIKSEIKLCTKTTCWWSEKDHVSVLTIPTSPQQYILLSLQTHLEIRGLFKTSSGSCHTYKDKMLNGLCISAALLQSTDHSELFETLVTFTHVSIKPATSQLLPALSRVSHWGLLGCDSWTCNVIRRVHHSNVDIKSPSLWFAETNIIFTTTNEEVSFKFSAQGKNINVNWLSLETILICLICRKIARSHRINRICFNCRDCDILTSWRRNWLLLKHIQLQHPGGRSAWFYW